ncbi:MAG TPA: hypothetical protein VJV78_20475 [Polyangiales bacterium]|nr:hypothetical protein [Polyangiales bacterium]
MNGSPAGGASDAYFGLRIEGLSLPVLGIPPDPAIGVLPAAPLPLPELPDMLSVPDEPTPAVPPLAGLPACGVVPAVPEVLRVPLVPLTAAGVVPLAPLGAAPAPPLPPAATDPGAMGAWFPQPRSRALDMQA